MNKRLGTWQSSLLHRALRGEIISFHSLLRGKARQYAGRYRRSFEQLDGLVLESPSGELLRAVVGSYGPREGLALKVIAEVGE